MLQRLKKRVLNDKLKSEREDNICIIYIVYKLNYHKILYHSQL